MFIIRYRRGSTIPLVFIATLTNLMSEGSVDSECCTCSSTTTRNAQSWVWKHFTIERQPAAKERFPPAKCKLCHKVVSRARGTTHPKAAVSRQISLLLFLLGDV